MGAAFPRDIGALLSCGLAHVEPTITSGAGADGVEQNGEIIDRQDALSAVFTVVCEAVLQAGETAIIQLTLQEDDDSAGGTMADVAAALQPGGAAATAVLTLTGETGGSTERGAYQFDVDLSSLKRYVRVQMECTLSSTATDTATVAVTYALGGRPNLS